MKHFRQKPSHRREPRPTAAQIILPPEHARAAARGDVTLHLRPVTSRDHRKRFHQGQRLAVRPSVGAATICHVHVIEVRGPTFDPAPMRLADVTFDDARAAGHKTTLAFKRAWLIKHDAAWVTKQEADVDDITDEDTHARFARHAHKPVWAIRFVVDIAGADRFLAARSEELYVENSARALSDEGPAVDEETQKAITDRAGMTTVQWQAQEAAHHDARCRSLSFEQRILAATRKARAHAIDVTRELWMLRTTQNQKRPAHMIEGRLEALERKAYTDPMRRAA